MRMVVLGDKEVEIITSENMLKKFESVTACAWKDGVLYISREVLENEKRKFGENFSETEVVEDIYRDARKSKNADKNEKWNYTLWDELLRRNLDKKYLSRNLGRFDNLV